MTYPPPPSQQPFPQPPPGGGYGAPPAHLRGRTPLRLALIFLLVGIVLVVIGAIIVGKKSLSPVNDFDRVNVAAGTGSISFTSTGSFVAYYEAGNVDNNTSTVPIVPVRLTSPSGKQMILDTLYGGSKTTDIKSLKYQYKGHNGVALYQFKISEKGTYKVELASAPGTASDADIAFGKSIAGGIVLGAALLIPGVLLLVTALILLIVGLVKRSRHKKELAAGAYGGGAPPNYPYPPQEGQRPPAAYPPPTG